MKIPENNVSLIRKINKISYGLIFITFLSFVISHLIGWCTLQFLLFSANFFIYELLHFFTFNFLLWKTWNLIGCYNKQSTFLPCEATTVHFVNLLITVMGTHMRGHGANCVVRILGKNFKGGFRSKKIINQ